MKPGARIADRFEVDRRAGAGGMCVVYRARDLVAGGWVALKLLARGDGRTLDRFEREARLLEELRHPGIVRHVHHGVTGDGERYLAMEWLDGEDLQERLRRAPLGVGEALTLARVVAESLRTKTLLGLRSRWTIPWGWAFSRVLTSGSKTETTVERGR